MKTTTTSLCIVLGLALGCSTPALADRGDYRGDYRGDHRGYYAPPQHDHHRGHHSRGYGWAAPAAVLAIAGIAAGVAASSYYAPRQAYVAPAQPVYVAPQPVYVEPPSAFWNYCGSLGQYYPNVRHCPEGWQLVPAR